MTEADTHAAAALLTRGFSERDLSYWDRAIENLRVRAVPDPYPRYGYVLEDAGKLVGILLTIFSRIPSDLGRVRCNLSSWYVEPDYRGSAFVLMTTVMKAYTEVVFVNVSAAPHTHALLEASGFVRYAEGMVFALPSLAAPVRGVVVRRHDPEHHDAAQYDPERQNSEHRDLEGAPDVLAAHARYGCISLDCVIGNETHAFVFLKRRIARGLLPCAQLIFCSDMRQFVRFAGPLGRFLLRRGMPVVLVDANGAIPKVPGHYYPGKGPKFFRGREAPRLGDLAYTEMVLFGP